MAIARQISYFEVLKYSVCFHYSFHHMETLCGLYPSIVVTCLIRTLLASLLISIRIFNVAFRVPAICSPGCRHHLYGNPPASASDNTAIPHGGKTGAPQLADLQTARQGGLYEARWMPPPANFTPLTKHATEGTPGTP